MTSANGDLVLGIDIGTSGVRIAAVDRNDGVVGFAAAVMPAPERIAGHIRQNPEIWWQAVRESMDTLGRTVDLGRVRAIAVDGTSGTVLAIDAEGHPCGPASLYNDRCEPEQAKRVADHAPPESAARGATSALGRALDLQDANPSARRIVHQADWIAGRFAGSYDTTDENNALKTGYDPVSRHWPTWMDQTGIDVEKLPRVIPAGAVIRPVDPALAMRLKGDTLVVAGTTDGCAAFLATGASRPGDGVTSLGTTLVLKLLCDQPIFAPNYGIYSHRIGDDWLAGGASNSGGAALLKFFTAERMAELEADMRPQDATGLDFYPLPSPGERFPINDPDLAPRVEPRPASETRFLQALFEGIAGIEKLGYDRLAELGGPKLRSVRSVGGGARNIAWGAIRAKMLAVPLEHPIHAEAACGAARLAWRGFDADRARS
jgi:hypothetical protein